MSKDGPQAALCRATMCCVRFAIWWRHQHGDKVAIDWDELPELGPGADRSQAHHEPPRSLGGVDHDTIPLSREYHTGGFHCRHRPRYDRPRHDSSSVEFYARYGVDWEAVRDVMRRRVGVPIVCPSCREETEHTAICKSAAAIRWRRE